jgi:membrane fusion protein
MSTEIRTSSVAVAKGGDTDGRVVPLFRHEVIDARRERALGDLLLVQPVSTIVLTAVAVGLASTLIAVTFWGEYTRKEHVSGYLVPTTGLIKVYSREVGTIVEKRVSEGQKVSKDDVLYVVSMERRSTDSLDTQAAAMAELRQRRESLNTELAQQGRIATIEAQSLRQRIASMESELGRLALELETQQQQVATAESTLGRYRTLLSRSLASEELVEEKTRNLLEEQGKLHALERSRLALIQDAESLRSQIESLQLKAETERESITRGMSQLAQELTEYESRRTFVVAAPANGTVTAVLAELGQTANPSQPLVSLLPENDELTVHLIVPSHAIGFLALDQTVAVRYQAFPYQRFGKYGARVTEISKTLIMPDEAVLPVPLKEPAYRVTARLDSQAVNAYGKQLPLKAGMVIDADIFLDRRKLYEWVLDPLYSVLGKV